MLINQRDIHTIIPQRPPFVMIDALTVINETGTHTELLITDDNVLLDNEIFSEAGLMENIAQTAAAGAGYTAQKNGDPISVGYIGAVKNFEVFECPRVGNVINTRVNIINHVFEVTIIEGEVTCDEKLLAKCEMKIFIKL